MQQQTCSGWDGGRRGSGESEAGRGSLADGVSDRRGSCLSLDVPGHLPLLLCTALHFHLPNDELISYLQHYFALVVPSHKNTQFSQ
jgi:hypothetical protein